MNTGRPPKYSKDVKEKQCTKCNIIKDISCFYKRKAHSSGYDYACKNCVHIKNRSYVKNNKEKIKAKWGDYYKEYNREYYRNNYNYRLGQLLRKRIRDTLKYNVNINDLIGCSKDELIKHLEQQFQSGMTWKNHGKYGWYIDHIIQLNSFDLSNPEHVKIAFHYTNLRPLWYKDNISRPKKDKKYEHF